MSKFLDTVFLFITLLVSLCCTSQHFYAVDSLLQSAYTNNQFNGTVLVAKQGKLLFTKSYGYADIKSRKPFSEKTSFQIASLSKQFTAFAIMLLHADGKLFYDDPVQKHISDFPYDNITIRHLLQHTSGLPDFWKQIRPYLDKGKANGNSEMLQFLINEKLPLQHEPGTKWIYSDIGYDLLGLIIETRSGFNYQQYLDNRVFKPAGMSGSKALMVTDIRKISSKNQALGYEYVKESGKLELAHLLKKNDFVFYLGNFYGDGSVISSTSDLLKWSQTLSKSKLLTNAHFQEALQPVKSSKDSSILLVPQRSFTPYYGFGWFLGEDPELGKFYHHGGGHPGFISYYAQFPEKDITIIFLSNLSAERTSQIRAAFVDLTLTILKKGFSSAN
jgi:CubicO group peptidase (beta-lactamase class C family)